MQINYKSRLWTSGVRTRLFDIGQLVAHKPWLMEKVLRRTYSGTEMARYELNNNVLQTYISVMAVNLNDQPSQVINSAQVCAYT